MEPEIDLRATLDCGQVFHWRERGDGAWEGLIGDEYAVVRQAGDNLEILRGEPGRVARYFALDHDLPGIYAGFPQDENMLAALDF